MHRKNSKITVATIFILLISVTLSAALAFFLLPVPIKWQTITFFGCLTVFMFAGVFIVSLIRKRRG